jgi:Tol biopolymer transport system component
MFSKATFRLLPLGAALALSVPSGLARGTSAQNNIEIIPIDLAGRQTNLTHNRAFDVNPTVARDGRIAFFSTRDGGGDLYVMDGDGRNVRRLTNGTVDQSGIEFGDDLEWSQASWSPHGDKIAFDGKYLAAGPPCEQHCANWHVLVVGSDGNGRKQVALGARAPAWSPGGRFLAYESGVDGYFGAGSVTIARPDGSSPVVTRAVNGVSSVGPVWSPRGGEIAFQAAAGARTWIYLVRADGTRKGRLTPGHNPTWSPDGRRLAFIDNCALITINRDGTRRRRVSREGELVVGAAWSPKRATLAYLTRTQTDDCIGLPNKLETVNAAGKHVHTLARWPASSLIWGNPVRTADGKRILVAGPAR